MFGPLLGGLARMGMDHLGEEAQKAAAKNAYNVYRKVHNKHGRKVRAWEDLTQREQEEWIAAVGDLIDEKIG